LVRGSEGGGKEERKPAFDWPRGPFAKPRTGARGRCARKGADTSLESSSSGARRSFGLATSWFGSVRSRGHPRDGLGWGVFGALDGLNWEEKFWKERKKKKKRSSTSEGTTIVVGCWEEEEGYRLECVGVDSEVFDRDMSKSVEKKMRKMKMKMLRLMRLRLRKMWKFWEEEKDWERSIVGTRLELRNTNKISFYLFTYFTVVQNLTRILLPL